jgi:hypothetical protein
VTYAYSEDKDQEDQSSKLAAGKYFKRPYFENYPTHKRTGVQTPVPPKKGY